MAIARAGPLAREVLLDLVDRKTYQVLVHLGAQHMAQIDRIGLAQDAKCARRRNHDQRLDPAGLDCNIELARELA
jgi:hypothetical protein